jgi:hypothetical protein
MNNSTPGEAERLSAFVQAFNWQEIGTALVLCPRPEAQVIMMAIYSNALAQNTTPMTLIGYAMEIGFRLGRAFENSEALERAFNPEAKTGAEQT